MKPLMYTLPFLLQAVSVEEMHGATGLGMTSVNSALSAGQVNHCSLSVFSILYNKLITDLIYIDRVLALSS